MKKKTGVLIRLMIITALVVVFVGINRIIDFEDLSIINPCNDSWLYAYQVDSVDVVENQLVVDGWFFHLDKYMNKEQIVDHTTELVVLLEILDPQTGKIILDDGSVASNDTNLDGMEIHGIVADVEKKVRNDVNEYFKCEYDYSNSGFSATFDISDLDMDHELYRLVFKEDAKSHNGLQANAYIYNGQLSYTNPVQMMQLDVEGTDLEEIVSNGVCLASHPNYHCSLYQYGWKLYWIADEGFYFTDEGSYIKYQLGTTQFDRLSRIRTENDWYWSNIGDLFEKYEITDEVNCGKYRVSVRDIPNGFSINAFETGRHNGENWVWHIDTIRPYYDFPTIPNPNEYGFLGDNVADWLLT